MPYELDSLQLALLSVCRETREPIHALHTHAEDWLARPLDTDEVEGVIRGMARDGLIAAFRLEAQEWVAVQTGDISASAKLWYLATPAGAAAAAAAWEQYFSE